MSIAGVVLNTKYDSIILLFLVPFCCHALGGISMLFFRGKKKDDAVEELEVVEREELRPEESEGDNERPSCVLERTSDFLACRP